MSAAMEAPADLVHPLARVLRDAADGRFPPVDGGVEILPPDPAGTHAIVAFTGHAYLLTGRSPDDPVFASVDGYGGATDPRLVVALAGRDGTIGSLDLVLVRRPPVDDHPAPLPEIPADDHPRVVRARRHRREVRVFGDERGLVTIGRGLAGRTEISLELTGARHGRGVGRELLRAVLGQVAPGEPVFAQVAPGNSASVRMFLACGFAPIGSEVLFEPG